jgi:DNA-binding transcriptional ArsR family regulator
MKLSLQEKIYKACAHEKRLEILRLLKATRYLTVGSIARSLGLSIQTASKHLQILERAHIIDREKEGLEVYYSAKRPASPLARTIISFL